LWNAPTRAELTPISNFYMGKNTPEREDLITDRLLVPVGEVEHRIPRPELHKFTGAKREREAPPH
jgi:hypothetical protein